jgi:hypothetical protein
MSSYIKLLFITNRVGGRMDVVRRYQHEVMEVYVPTAIEIVASEPTYIEIDGNIVNVGHTFDRHLSHINQL